MIGKSNSPISLFTGGKTKDKIKHFHPFGCPVHVLKAKFDCYVDADFCGNWDRSIAAEDPDTARSRSGFILMYAGAPLYWQSKLQTQFALSTAESELLALSSASKHAKSMMNLLDELKERGLEVASVPDVHCNMFEDNQAALTIATVPKMRPRTRHLNVIYHQFRNEVANKRLCIHPIDTGNQLADGLTKQLPLATFERHRLINMGW